MNPRVAILAALCREIAIPASVLAWLAAVGSAGFDNTGAAPIVDSPAPSLAAATKFADKPPLIALGTADVAAASRSMTAAAAVNATPASRESKPIVTAALTAPSEMLKPETPDQADENSVATREPGDANPAASPTEVLEECFVADTCIDRYLWALYQRAPKEDSVKIQEQRKVTVKKKRKLVTVTKTFTKLADEDFSWKDPKAAERAGMPLVDYVIGGMDRDFKLKLFHLLYAAEEAGLSPGITSAFRDDYRQSIASGLKAANDRSYHGGSSRGGYGHGLAADIVSVHGATRAQRLTSTETLWNWVDAHGKEFGIGRPYLDRDPPHVAPIDGKEYADHHPGMKARLAGSAAKTRHQLAMRDERRAAKHARTARSSKVRTI
jgi:D-alanyl-D-alanine carboxypeptidase